MRKTLLVTNLIVLACLSGSSAVAQRAGDSKKTTPASPSLDRVQQLLSLVDSKPDDAPAKLKEALSDENWYVRGQAARALGRLGDRSSASVLMAILQDESWFVRVSALEAIAALGATKDAAELRDAMAATDGYVRARAAASSPVAGNGAVEPLIKALGDGDQLV